MKDKRITIAPVSSVLSHVRELRKTWGLEEHREMWFRAEDARHFSTTLQPKLYRPRKGKKPKPAEKFLRIESDLYNEFERCAGELSDLQPEDTWDFEWYFLMQHHGAPTRLLDWSDGYSSPCTLRCATSGYLRKPIPLSMCSTPIGC